MKKIELIEAFNNSTQDPVAKLMFQVLGAFAEFERNIIKERQREGIAKAKEAGKYSHGKGGRKKSVDRDKVKLLRAKGVSLRNIAKRIGCSLSSVQRCLDENKFENIPVPNELSPDQMEWGMEKLKEVAEKWNIPIEKTINILSSREQHNFYQWVNAGAFLSIMEEKLYKLNKGK